MNGGLKLAVLICIICYAILRWVVRRVWYRREHDRPVYFRHIHVIHAVDWFAWLLIGVAFFLVLNSHRWWLALLVAVGAAGCDIFLHQAFLLLEARRMRKQQPGLTLERAKRRLLERARREQ